MLTTWIQGCRILVLVLAVLVMTPEAEASSVEDIRQRGELVMLCFPHQQSVFVRLNLKAGPMPRIGRPDRFEGIDVELMKLFAHDLGVELKIRPVRRPSYRDLIPDLLAGKGDLIASSFSITPQRRKIVAFSDPYFSVYPVIVARQGSSLSSLDDLDDLTAVTVAGSSNHAKLRQLDIDLKKIVKVDFMIEAFEKTLDGEADFTLLESAIIRRNRGLARGLEVAFRLAGTEGYGFAVPLDSGLREELDRFLARLKASGTLGEIIDRHLVSLSSSPD